MEDMDLCSSPSELRRKWSQKVELAKRTENVQQFGSGKSWKRKNSIMDSHSGLEAWKSSAGILPKTYKQMLHIAKREIESPSIHPRHGLEFLRTQVRRVKFANRLAALAEKEAAIEAKQEQLARRRAETDVEFGTGSSARMRCSSHVPLDIAEVDRRIRIAEELDVPTEPAEAMAWAKQLIAQPAKAGSVASKHFYHFDENKGGFFELVEIPPLVSYLCGTLGVMQPPAEDIEAIFKAADTNNTNKLGLLEFVGFFQQSLQVLVESEKDDFAHDEEIRRLQAEMAEDVKKLQHELVMAKSEAGRARSNERDLLESHSKELSALHQHLKQMEQERDDLRAHGESEVQRLKALLECEEEEREATERTLMKLKAELKASQAGSDTVGELQSKLERLSCENRLAVEAKEAATARMNEMMQKGSNERDASENQLEQLRVALAIAERSAVGKADPKQVEELKRQLAEKSVQHDALLQKQRQDLNSELAQERKLRLFDIATLRKELAATKVSDSAMFLDLQKRLDEKTRENEAALEAQTEILNTTLLDARSIAEKEREQLQQELMAAQRQGAADAEALRDKLAMKDGELQETRMAHQVEVSRLNGLVGSMEEKHREGQRGIDALRCEVAEARASNSAEKDNLQRLLEERSAQLKATYQAEQEWIRQQFESEHRARLIEMDKIKQEMANAQAGGLAVREKELRVEFERKSASDKAILQAQQEALHKQLVEERKRADLLREQLEEQLRASKEQERMGEAQKEEMRIRLQAELDAQTSDYEAKLRTRRSTRGMDIDMSSHLILQHEKERAELQAEIEKMRAHLQDSTMHAGLNQSLQADLHELMQQYKLSGEAHRAEKERMCELLGREDKRREATEKELAFLREKLTQAEAQGLNQAQQEYQRLLQNKSRDYEVRTQKHREAMESELEQERIDRARELKETRNEMEKARDQAAKEVATLKRKLDMKEAEHAFRMEAQERKLHEIRDEHASAAASGDGRLAELQGRLEDTTNQHARELEAYKAQFKDALEDENFSRLRELEQIRKEHERAEQNGLVRVMELQTMLDRQSAEHGAILQAQQESFAKHFEAERNANKCSLEQMSRELQHVQTTSATSSEAWSQRMLQKDREHQEALAAREAEAERLRGLLEEHKSYRRASHIQADDVLLQLQTARHENNASAAELRQIFNTRTKELQQVAKDQQEMMSMQFAAERQSRLKIMNEMRINLANARRRDDPGVDEFQRSIDEKVLKDKAIWEAQQQFVKEQLELDRKEVEMLREQLVIELEAAKKEQEFKPVVKQQTVGDAAKEMQPRRSALRKSVTFGPGGKPEFDQLHVIHRNLQGVGTHVPEVQREEVKPVVREQTAHDFAKAKLVAQEHFLDDAAKATKLAEELKKAESTLKQMALPGDRVVAVYAPPGAQETKEREATVETTDSVAGTITVKWDRGYTDGRTVKVSGRVKKLVTENMKLFTVKCLFAGVTRQFLVGTWTCHGEHQVIAQVFADEKGKTMYQAINPVGIACTIEKTQHFIKLNISPHLHAAYWKLKDRSVTAAKITWLHSDTAEAWEWTRS